MEFMSIIGLFGCSLFFHNGFSPVFSVMRETRRGEHIRRAPVYVFFIGKLLFDAITGVLPMTIYQYPCYYCAWIVAEKTAIGSATLFYLMSNSICWLQMSPTPICPNISWCIYSSDIAGWCACMVAGLPYYLNSIVATVTFCLFFRLIREYGLTRFNQFNNFAY